MQTKMKNKSNFTLGLDAGAVGRWLRLILGGIVPLAYLINLLYTQSPSPSFYGATVIYTGLIFLAYLVAHYLLGPPLFAYANPWVNTLILAGPPTAVLVLQLGPPAFQLALAFYISISLIINFVLSYGGCEVVAIPSLLLGQKYVVYCPWNVVDVVDKVIVERQVESQTIP